MANIILKRTKESFGRLNKYKIYLNGDFVTKIGQHEEKSINVEDNVVEIQAKEWFYGSQKEKIKVEDNTVIEIIGNSLYNRMSIFLGVPIVPLVIIYNGTNLLWLKYLSLVLLILLLLWSIYIFTVAKNKWIRIIKQ